MRIQHHHENRMGLTFGVQLLLILNIGAYVAERVFGIPLRQFFSLRADWLSHGAFWELVTYQFLHEGFRHLFFNMLALFFLGPEIERTMGTNRFFKLYLFSGVLGGLGWSILSLPSHVCVGASGAVFGILGAYAALYPNRELVLIIFPFMPIKAWILVLALGAFEFHQTLTMGEGGTIANSAHLGGGIAGYIYALTIGRPDIMRKVRRKIKSKTEPPVDPREINRILDKAVADGLHSLTPAERALLKRAGKK
jgi:membrane associated rhomboid family serine protease